MSQAALWGRSTPRWSVVGQSGVDAASIAGLPSRSACVRVGPPLSASGPSLGSMGKLFGLTLPTWLPSVFVMPLPLPSPIRLKRAKTTLSGLGSTSTSGPVGALFCATRLFVRLDPRSELASRMPPASWVAELRATVLFVSATPAGQGPELEMPPPRPAELPETVLFVSATPAEVRQKPKAWLRMPPPSWVAELPKTALLVIVTPPGSRLAMPPPLAAESRATVLLVSVSPPALAMPPPSRRASAPSRFAARFQPQRLLPLLRAPRHGPPYGLPVPAPAGGRMLRLVAVLAQRGVSLTRSSSNSNVPSGSTVTRAVPKTPAWPPLTRSIVPCRVT
jgi:hypothetical protein